MWGGAFSFGEVQNAPSCLQCGSLSCGAGSVPAFGLPAMPFSGMYAQMWPSEYGLCRDKGVTDFTLPPACAVMVFAPS